MMVTHSGEPKVERNPLSASGPDGAFRGVEASLRHALFAVPLIHRTSVEDVSLCVHSVCKGYAWNGRRSA